MAFLDGDGDREMKIKKMTVMSLLFCAISMVCYYGYHVLNNLLLDQTYPEITIVGEELVLSIEDGEEALLTGVSAYDEKDGDVTGSIVVESVSRFANGKRTVVYAAFDSDDHVTKAEREISYEDYEPPKFSCTEGYRFPMGVKSVVNHMTATDLIDGDLSGVIKVSPGYYADTSTPGTYAIQYQVANSAGDVEYLPVTVEIYDPSDSKLLNVSLTQYVVYTEAGTRIDPTDYVGDNPYTVRADDSQVDYDTPGTYEIIYSMKSGDSRGTNRLAVVVR